MPLFEKARIEVYLPDLPTPAYQELLEALSREFTYAFGGASIIRGLDGCFLSKVGSIIQDRINLIYTHVPFAFQENFEKISRYSDKLRNSVRAALEEEAILVVVAAVFHAE